MQVIFNLLFNITNDLVYTMQVISTFYAYWLDSLLVRLSHHPFNIIINLGKCTQNLFSNPLRIRLSQKKKEYVIFITNLKELPLMTDFHVVLWSMHSLWFFFIF